jgi:hypothetical protein
MQTREFYFCSTTDKLAGMSLAKGDLALKVFPSPFLICDANFAPPSPLVPARSRVGDASVEAGLSREFSRDYRDDSVPDFPCDP